MTDSEVRELAPGDEFYLFVYGLPQLHRVLHIRYRREGDGSSRNHPSFGHAYVGVLTSMGNDKVHMEVLSDEGLVGMGCLVHENGKRIIGAELVVKLATMGNKRL